MPSSARWYRPRQDRGGGYQSARGDVGRRTAAHGDSCSRRGHCPCRMHPPFSFPSCGKENGPYPQGVCRIRKRQSRQRLRNRTVQKKRPLGRAPVQWPSALTGVGVSVQAPILARLRARYTLLQLLEPPSRGGWCRPCRGGCRIASASLFAAAGLEVSGSRCSGPMRASAPTGMRKMWEVMGLLQGCGRSSVFRGCGKPSPFVRMGKAARFFGGCGRVLAFCGDTESHRFCGGVKGCLSFRECPKANFFRGYLKATVQVGADALIRPLGQASTTTRPAHSSCAAVGGSAAYGCGVPLAGKAECAEGGTSGTLVTEILGAPQRETVKEEQAKCVPAPRPKTHPRHGTAVPTPAEENSVPEGRAKPAQAPVRRPPYSAEARRCRSAPSAFFSSTGRGAFSFWARLKGAPAAPRAVGRGGAPKPTKWARKRPWGAGGAGAVFAAGGNGA